MARKPIIVEVLEERGQRVVVATYADGQVVRTIVQPGQKPRRRPRKPYARAGLDRKNRTRRKTY